MSILMSPIIIIEQLKASINDRAFSYKCIMLLLEFGVETSWKFEESLLDAEHAVCVCTNENEREFETFTQLSVCEVLALFDDDDSGSALLRPLHPADFSLYDGKATVKPF